MTSNMGREFIRASILEPNQSITRLKTVTKLTRRNCLLLVLSKTDKTKLLICLLWCSVNKVDIRRTAFVLLQWVEGSRKKRTYEIVYIFVYIYVFLLHFVLKVWVLTVLLRAC